MQTQAAAETQGVPVKTFPLVPGILFGKEFNQRAKLLANFVERKCNIPSYTWCALHTGGLTVVNYDGQSMQEITLNLPLLRISDDHTFIVEFHVFLKAMSSKQGDVVLMFDRNRQCVTLDESITLPLQDQKNWGFYSAEIGRETSDTFTLPSSLGAVAQSASQDTTRPHLTGVFVSLKHQEIVASNGHILSWDSITSVQPSENEGIVSMNVVKVLSRCTKVQAKFYQYDASEEEYEEKKIKPGLLKSTHMIFTAEELSIICRLDTGLEFPNYHQVIPESTECEVKIDREELLAAVTECIKFLQHKGGVRFDGKEDHFLLTAQNAGSEITITKKVPATGARGLLFGLNPDYLSIVLRSHKGKVVVLRCQNNEKATDSPLLFIGDVMQTVIMPMRIF